MGLHVAVTHSAPSPRAVAEQMLHVGEILIPAWAWVMTFDSSFYESQIQDVGLLLTQNKA